MPLEPSTTPSHVLTVSQQNYGLTVEENNWDLTLAYAAISVAPNNITSSTTTNFTSGNVLFANSGFVGSLSRSGIDTRTSFPNADVTAATPSPTAGTIVRRDSDGAVNFATSNTEGITLSVSSSGNPDNTEARTIQATATGTAGIAGDFTSSSGTAIIATSNTGTYHARFGNAGNNQSAIERVRGWFVWFYGAFTGRLKTADITANRDWTLPNASGTIALTTDIVDSVTSATTSDGTANLSISNVSTTTATVSGLLTAGHIHGNIAGTLYTHVRTGEAMAKGDPFYISGYHNGDGGYPIVGKAKASDPTKMPAIGVMDASYAANVNGANGIISGTISGINTSGFVANKPVYVGGDGGYSNVAGDIAQQIGITERVNNSTGAFIVTNAKRDPIERFVYLTEADLVTIDGSQVFNLTTQGVYTISSLPEEAWSGIVVIPSADSGQYVVINQSGYDGEIHAGIGNSIADLFFGKRVTLFFDYGGALAWNVSESTGSAVGIREAKTDNPDGIPDALTDGTISGITVFSDGSFVYDGGAAEAHRTALGLDTLFDGKANLIGGNTFTGSQSINGSITTSDKVTVDSTSAVANPKMLIMSTTAQGAADNVPLVIKGSGVNKLASINLRSTGGSGELYDAWLSGKVGGGIQVNNSFTVSSGNSGPITGSTIFIVQSTGGVGIGVASPNTKAALDITSTTKGFLPPRMTTTERNAIATPPAGLVIYNTTTNNLNSYSGSAWVELVDSADLGTNVANFLTSPTSDNLASALTDENGTGGGFVRAEGATLTGATLSGQTELTSSQTGATQYSVATRSMAEDSLIWASRVRLHASQVSGTISFGGSVGGTVGQFSQLALSNTVNSLSRVALATNFLALSYSGSGTNFGIPWQIRIPFGSIITDTNSVFRVWTGSHIANIGVPYNGADGIPMGMSSIGFEFRANPSSSNQHQIRLIARDGRSQQSSGYSLTNGSPIISGLSTSAVNSIAAEIAAGRTVYAMSGTLSNVAPDSKGFSDGAVVISATGTTVTLDRNAVTTNASVQMRFVFAAEAGTFAASSWVNVGPIGGLNRQYDTVIENLGNGTANLYCVGWSSDIIPPLQTRVPIATLSTGVPTTAKYVTVGSQALEAHLITNGVNAPPTITSNLTSIFNAITKIGI